LEGEYAYAFYVDDWVDELVLVNMQLYYANSTSDFTVKVDLLEMRGGEEGLNAKRLTALYVNSGNSSQTSWAGQSFPQGELVGDIVVEVIGEDNVVSVRGSEAVLVFFGGDMYSP
jgi:hypothetical protein